MNISFGKKQPESVYLSAIDDDGNDQDIQPHFVLNHAACFFLFQIKRESASLERKLKPRCLVFFILFLIVVVDAWSHTILP